MPHIRIWTMCVLGLSLALSRSASADIRPPIKITMDPALARPAASGAIYESEPLIRVRASGELSEPRIESDAAWQVIDARVPAAAEFSLSQILNFSAKYHHPSDFDPLENSAVNCSE